MGVDGSLRDRTQAQAVEDAGDMVFDRTLAKLTTRAAAISRLVAPWAIRRSTSHSMGHTPAFPFYGDCLPRIIATFWANPAATLDPGCITKSYTGSFVSKRTIYPTAAIYRLNSQVIVPGNMAQLGIIGGYLLVFGGGLIVTGWAMVRRRGTRSLRWVAGGWA